ncbi:MAG: metal transporter [Deinococcota bacterium]
MSSPSVLKQSPSFAWLWAVIPLALLAALIAIFINSDPLKPLGVSAPPIESLTVERVTLDDTGIHLQVRADGSEPISIAQIQVDGAYWMFTQSPAGELRRLQTATLDIPYPWVQDETHHLTILSKTGVPFEHEIAVATPTPSFSWSRLLAFALLGIYVGVVPVSLGLLFFPYLRTLGQRGLQFLLALTLGLLGFLLVDTLQEGLELAAGAAGAFQANALVWLAAGLSFLILMAVGRRKGHAPEGLSLASYLALGIGLHNLGEGLAIGAAFAIGEAALGSFLVIGFTLHNITEGIGIAAPLTKHKTNLGVFIALAALAGLPAVLGTWVGAFAFSPHWAALFLGIGVGAILQVMVEVGAYLARTSHHDERNWLSLGNLTGFSLGLTIMYFTAFFVNI